MTVSSARTRQDKQIRDVKIRAAGLISVLEKTNKILGENTFVTAESSSVAAPAFTDGETITINSRWEPLSGSLLDGFTSRSIAVVTALNYHELAHVLFTPRLESAYVRDVRASHAFTALNILEDQSAETRFVKLYEPSRHYFASLVSQYMRDGAEANYVLLSGRKFLPSKIRDAFRDAFRHPELIDDIDDCVATYKSLVYPHETKGMYEQVLRMRDLLDKMRQGGGTLTFPVGGHDSNQLGQPDSDLADDLQQIDEFIDESDGESVDLGADEESGEEEVAEGSSEGSGEESTGQQGDASSEEGDGQDGDEDPSGDGHSDEYDELRDGGSNSGSKPSYDLSEILDKIDDAFDELFEEIEDDLQEKIRSVRDESRNNYRVRTAEVERGHVSSITSEMNRSLQDCIDELRAIENRYAPGWHNQQRSGKIDHRRYAKALRGSDEIYRRWKDGAHNSMDFEAVFLIDRSGSMYTSINKASQALWVLKRMFEEYNGSCTVFSFAGEEDTQLVSQRNEKASMSQYTHWGAGGGTVVSRALEEAMTVIQASSKTLKLVILLTDGSFHDRQESKQVASYFPRGSILLIGLGTPVDKVWEGSESVLERHRINDPYQLVDVVKSVTAAISEQQAKSEVYR